VIGWPHERGGIKLEERKMRRTLTWLAVALIVVSQAGCVVVPARGAYYNYDYGPYYYYGPYWGHHYRGWDHDHNRGWDRGRRWDDRYRR
jgi:hypothetical protein